MAHRRWGRKRPALGKGALAGAMAGLAGAWAMNEFQALLSKATQKQQDNGARATTEKQPKPTPGDEEGDATQRIAAHCPRRVRPKPNKTAEKCCRACCALCNGLCQRRALRNGNRTFSPFQ